MPNVPALPPITRGLLPHAEVKQNGKSISLLPAILSVTRTLSLLLSIVISTYTQVHTHSNACTYSTKMQTGNRTNAYPYELMHTRAYTHLYLLFILLLYTRTHARTYTRTHARTHERTNARTHERTNARTHTQTYTHTYCISLSPPSLPKSLETNPKRRIRTNGLVNITINQ